MPGSVPQVIIGASLDTSTAISLSKRAPSSVCHAPDPIIPARAPASIDMLQTVIRSSIDIAETVLPAYSITEPVPPPTPSLAMTARITSLAVTPGCKAPSMETRIVFGLRCRRHCVASTCATSLVPMPKASAPNAPCVEVWLSPQTTVIPGFVRPSSGPMTWTIPWLREPSSCSSMPCSRQLRASVSTCVSASPCANGNRPFTRGNVGVE